MSLANSKGLEFGELLDEVEAIVYSGTKINISYFLNEIMDDDRQEDIYEYFRESESDDLDSAFKEPWQRLHRGGDTPCKNQISLGAGKLIEQ